MIDRVISAKLSSNYWNANLYGPFSYFAHLMTDNSTKSLIKQLSRFLKQKRQLSNSLTTKNASAILGRTRDAPCFQKSPRRGATDAPAACTRPVLFPSPPPPNPLLQAHVPPLRGARIPIIPSPPVAYKWRRRPSPASSPPVSFISRTKDNQTSDPQHHTS